MKVTYKPNGIFISNLKAAEVKKINDCIDDIILESKKQSNHVLPRPVVRDGTGKLVEKYTWLDWIAKLNEELDEVKYAVSEFEDKCGDYTFDEDEGLHTIAEELQDLITVATSMQESYLGYNETIRQNICKEVNEKNEKRGYFNKE